MAFFSTAHQKHSRFLFWRLNSQTWVMFHRNFRNLSKGAHDQGENAAAAKGVNTNMAWFTPEFFYSIPLFLFCTAEQCTCQTMYLTFQKHVMSLVKLLYWHFLASAVWFVFDFVSFCLWMMTRMNRNVQLSSPWFNTSSFLFKNLCFDSYQLFPLEALLSFLLLLLLKSESLDEDLSSENMWWRLVSSFSQIKPFIFYGTTLPCNSYMSCLFRLHVGLIFLH